MSGYHLYRTDLPACEKALADRMVNGYYLIMTGRIPSVLNCSYSVELLMVNGPYQYAEDAENDWDRVAKFTDETMVDIESYWCGPDDEPDLFKKQEEAT